MNPVNTKANTIKNGVLMRRNQLFRINPQERKFVGKTVGVMRKREPIHRCFELFDPNAINFQEKNPY